MKAGFVQTSPRFGDIRWNVDDAVERIRALCGSTGATLVALPELFSTGYQFKSAKEALDLAEDASAGYAAKRLGEAAKELGVFIVAGFAEKSGRKVYNSAVLIGPKGRVGTYRKAHLFSNEKKIFSPGDTPFEVYKAGRARVGMMICFDWLFPEAARTLALKGADIICHPSNLVLPYCPAAMITRSLENRVYAVTANRVGAEERISGKRLKFIGTSQIIAPDGKVIARAGRVRPCAHAADFDLKAARDKRITPVNDIFKDRRTGFYEL
ncbi:MAG: acyltransferase [Deltaproteobacteria bacterium]|nr:acyltransferase [Deltaproteobacteria bacterium]